MKWPSIVDSLIEKMKNPLHLAVADGLVTVISDLLNQGADVNATEIEGITPLHVAIKKKRISVLKLLLKSGANVNSTDFKYTPLHFAVYARKVEILKLLLESEGINLEAKDSDGYTPLYLAASSENDKTLKLLLEAGASVDGASVDGDSEDDFGSKTPVYSAIYSRKIGNLTILLEAGADFNKGSTSRYTLLDMIIRRCLFKHIFKILARYGLNFNDKNVQGKTLLSFLIGKLSLPRQGLISNASLECLKFFLKHTDVNITDKDGKNMLCDSFESVPNKEKYKYLCTVILQHIAKLKSLNVDVDAALLDMISRTNDYNEYFTKCMQELEKAKETKLQNCWVTFFNLIVDNRLNFVKYAGNQDLIEDSVKNVENFPIYGSKMQKNVSKGIEGRKLWDRAADILSYSMPIFNPTHLIIGDVLNTLKMRDWKNLCGKETLME